MFVGLDEEQRIQKGKVGTRDEFLAHSLDTTVFIKKHEDQLRRTTRDLRKRVVSILMFKVGYSNIYFKL